MRKKYDIIVIGGGHAGCEAAMAAAKLGSYTLLITMDMTKFAAMSCNPAIGGIAKGQIVREIDALGGMTGIITDRSTIQFRMLNKSKGPAMWSPRAQCDKSLFSRLWRKELENTRRLYLFEDAVTELIFSGDNKKVTGIRTRLGLEFECNAVILTAGTFLNGKIHVGSNQAEGGRAGDPASYGLTEQLISIGFEAGRMKTGTPVRIDARTVNFEVLKIQEGDEEPSKFSYIPDTEPVRHQVPCFLAYTNGDVHKKLSEGFSHSPLFNGTIKGIGPRYCPSIEDKLVTFSDKDSHQLFLEPEGLDTNEYYLNGFSSSLPSDIQIDALKLINGFGDIHIFRPGYAIEYDYFPSTQLYHTLETKLVEGLYFAGQVNGTTGYEEAGAQGLMAGINAHLKINKKEEFILRRDQAYIGVLIDDLVTKGVDEPYRMFTSRAEYRILLRQDNADLRLTPLAYEIGLADEKRYQTYKQKDDLTKKLVYFLRKHSIVPEDFNGFLTEKNSPILQQNRKAYDLLLRNEISIQDLIDNLSDIKAFISADDYTDEIIQQAEIQIKYKGYIEREKHLAEKLVRLENIKIRPDFEYNSLNSLTIEARQKLSKIKPSTIGQASRIPGVSPADINVLLVYFGR